MPSADQADSEAAGPFTESWLRFVETYPEPVLVICKGEVRFANPAGARLFGVPAPDHLAGRRLSDFFPARCRDALDAQLASQLARPGPEPVEYQIVGPTGDERLLACYAASIWYEGEAAVQAVLRDVTDQRRDAERYRAFFEAKAEGLWCVELPEPIPADTAPEQCLHQLVTTGVLVECTEVMGHLLGVATPVERPGVPVAQLPLLQQLLASFHAEGNRQSWETDATTAYGERRLLVSARNVVQHGWLVRLWGTCTETVAPARFERALLAALEEQRQEFGRELHDGVGQLMTAIRLLCGDIAELSTDELSRQTAHHALQFVEEAATIVSGMYWRLSPPALVAGRSLGRALADLAAHTNAIPRVQCACHTDEGVEIPDQTVEFQLYRIAQEAVNNALKHARASQIDLFLCRAADGAVVLRIVDNGIGMDPARVRRSIGLDSMHHRARLIGATLTITSSPDRGTAVACVLQM